MCLHIVVTRPPPGGQAVHGPRHRVPRWRAQRGRGRQHPRHRRLLPPHQRRSVVQGLVSGSLNTTGGLVQPHQRQSNNPHRPTHPHLSPPPHSLRVPQLCITRHTPPQAAACPATPPRWAPTRHCCIPYACRNFAPPLTPCRRPRPARPLHHAGPQHVMLPHSLHVPQLCIAPHTLPQAAACPATPPRWAPTCRRRRTLCACRKSLRPGGWAAARARRAP